NRASGDQSAGEVAATSCKMRTGINSARAWRGPSPCGGERSGQSSRSTAPFDRARGKRCCDAQSSSKASRSPSVSTLFCRAGDPTPVAGDKRYGIAQDRHGPVNFRVGGHHGRHEADDIEVTLRAAQLEDKAFVQAVAGNLLHFGVRRRPSLPVSYE